MEIAAGGEPYIAHWLLSGACVPGMGLIADLERNAEVGVGSNSSIALVV